MSIADLGSGRVYPVGREKLSFDIDKYRSKINESPLVSSAIGITATGTTEAVEIPAGAYVTAVQVLCTGAVASADIDVGDGSSTDRFIDGVTTMAANDIITAPNVASGAACDEVAGHYYSTADTIDVKVNATATSGTIQLLVYYVLLT